MRKFIGFAAACMVIMFGFLSIRALPVETKSYIAKKYAGYSGVIKCWICADFSCAGSFNAWLNSCAAPFERAHDGVYIEIETVSAAAMAAHAQAIVPPDMIFYSPSTTDSENLTGITLLAMGSTTAITRTGVQFDPARCAVGREANRDLAAAAIFTGSGSGDAQSEDTAIIDLGLPVGTGAAMTADQALQTFIDGKTDCAIVTSAQLAKLIDRRDRGLPPDWECVSPNIAFTDQLLLGAACCDGEKQAICHAFLAQLMSEENQRALAGIGAHSPIMRIYPDTDSRSIPDAALAGNNRLLRRIDTRAQTDCIDILYRLRSGDLDIAAAQEMAAARYNSNAETVFIINR